MPSKDPPNEDRSIWKPWSVDQDTKMMSALERAWQAAMSEGIEPEEAERQLEDTFHETWFRASRHSGELLLEELYRTAPAMLSEHRRIQKAFENRLAKAWAEPLDSLYMMLVACHEVGDGFNQANRPQAVEDDDVRFDALVSLHARACLVASAIWVLLRTGHALSARAHWRTLHEITVVASVLADGDAELSRRYLDHSTVEAYKDALLDEQFRERTQRAPWDSEDLERLKSAAEMALEKYGPDFSKPWAWASDLTANPDFKKLAELSGLDHLRPDYRTASHLVHAGSTGTSFIKQLRHGTSFLLAGPTTEFLVEPGHGMAVSLLQVTSTLVLRGHSQPGPTALAALGALELLTDRIGEQFLDANNRLDKLELAYWEAASAGVVPLRFFLLRQKVDTTRWLLARWVRGHIGEVARRWKGLTKS